MLAFFCEAIIKQIKILIDKYTKKNYYVYIK